MLVRYARIKPYHLKFDTPLFLIAARLPTVFSWLFCILGSLLIGVAALETWLLFTSQRSDGIANSNNLSKYAGLEGSLPEYAAWYPNECGKSPAQPGKSVKVYQKVTKFGEEVFDTLYHVNAKGWRRMPEAKEDADNDLMIFGCSFSYGYGLRDEETWAWQLAKRLGSDWRVENYAGSGYSANHMLCLLEHHLVANQPGKNKFALFLAFEGHIPRNEYFPITPHYLADENGKPKAGGKQAYNWLYGLPFTLNGSQLAREARDFAVGMAMQNTGEPLDLYLAMIKESSDLLAKDYDTRLLVLLWPGFEFIQKRLEDMGIPVILLKSLLPDWDKGDKPGSLYRISPYDEHPNALAALEIANGVSKKLEELAK